MSAKNLVKVMEVAGASSSTATGDRPLAVGAASVTAMVNVWYGETSMPPLAVPPLSRARTRTLAGPQVPTAGGNRRVPSAGTTGAGADGRLPGGPRTSTS